MNLRSSYFQKTRPLNFFLYLPKKIVNKSIGHNLSLLDKRIKRHNALRNDEKSRWKYNFRDGGVLNIPSIAFNVEKTLINWKAQNLR